MSNSGRQPPTPPPGKGGRKQPPPQELPGAIFLCPGTELTPTQRRMMALLQDGERHTTLEIRACMNDELAGNGVLRLHISNLRKKLRCQYVIVKSVAENRKRFFQLVRLVSQDD